MRVQTICTAALSSALLFAPVAAHAQAKVSGEGAHVRASTSPHERSGQQLKRGSLRSAPARRPSEHQSKQIDDFLKNNEAQIRAASLKGC